MIFVIILGVLLIVPFSIMLFITIRDFYEDKKIS